MIRGNELYEDVFQGVSKFISISTNQVNFKFNQLVGVEMPVDDPRYDVNAPIQMRWPIPWEELINWDQGNGRIEFEVAVAIKNRRSPYRPSMMG